MTTDSTVRNTNHAMYLIFDTETSTLPVNQSADHPGQARVIQIGALLLDEAFRTKAELNLLLDWKVDYEIHPKAFEAHGITREDCAKYGTEPGRAFELLASLRARARLSIAHNIKFDLKLIDLWQSQVGLNTIDTTAHCCTMTQMTDVCKIPGQYGRHKWPTLQEAHTHIMGVGFDGAHDAMADVRACATVFKWMKAHNL